MIKESEIHGVGVHVNREFPERWSFGVTRWYRTSSVGDSMVIRTPLGGFINHSDDPNCEMVDGINGDFGPFSALVSIREISPGEELTVSYTLPEYEREKWRRE